MQNSPRLGLPFLAPGQAQKEVTHNEALLALDAMVQSVCLGSPGNAPPETASDGQLFLCADAPSGEWAGQANAVAHKTSSGWRFIQPFDGMTLTEQDSGMCWTYRDGDWNKGSPNVAEVRVRGIKVIGSRQPAIVDPVGGATHDVEGRAAIASILMALRQHGLIAP